MVFTGSLQKVKVQCNQIYTDKLKIFLNVMKGELDRLTFFMFLFYCSQFIYILRGEVVTVHTLGRSKNTLGIHFDNHRNKCPKWVSHLGNECFQLTLHHCLHMKRFRYIN